MTRLRLTVVTLASLIAGILLFNEVDVRVGVAAQTFWFNPFPPPDVLPEIRRRLARYGNMTSTVVAADFGQLCILDINNGASTSAGYPWGTAVRGRVNFDAAYVTADGNTYTGFIVAVPGDQTPRPLVAFAGPPWTRLDEDAGDIRPNTLDGVHVTLGNTTGTPFPEVVTANGDLIQVVDVDSGDVVEARPFGANGNLNIHLAVGDANGDGFDEIFATEGNDGGRGLVVLEHRNGQLTLVAHGNPIGDNHDDGVTVSTLDVTGDGIVEVFTGSVRGQARVRGFDIAGGTPSPIVDFIADSGWNGVKIAVGFNAGAPMMLTASGRHIRAFVNTPEGDWQPNTRFAPTPFGTGSGVNFNVRMMTPPRRDITRP
jgi:hypothetical protein